MHAGPGHAARAPGGLLLCSSSPGLGSRDALGGRSLLLLSDRQAGLGLALLLRGGRQLCLCLFTQRRRLLQHLVAALLRSAAAAVAKRQRGG